MNAFVLFVCGLEGVLVLLSKVFIVRTQGGGPLVLLPTAGARRPRHPERAVHVVHEGRAHSPDSLDAGTCRAGAGVDLGLHKTPK